MVEEGLIKPNPDEQKIIEKIQALLGVELEQVAEIKWKMRRYTVIENGAVVGLGLYDCGIDNKKLKELVEVLRELTSLRRLSLDNNQLNDLSPLGALTRLTTLYVSNNKLTDLSALGSLTSLTTLDLRNIQLTDLSGLAGLTSLTWLDLRGNQLTDLAGLTSLTELYLSDNQITDVSGLTELTSLTTLDLGHNQLTDISALAALTRLTTLKLSNNQITDLSPLAALKGLRGLYLHNNQLTNLSPLAALTRLTTLDLSNNKLTDLSALGSLTSLTTLNLRNIRLTDMSPLAALTSLTTLDISSNKLTDLSDLGSMTNLTTLNLRSNKMTDLAALGPLMNLTTLNLSLNHITNLSPLAALTSLTELDLSNNQITDLSPLTALTSLTELDLSNNQLFELTGLESLTSLTKLFLSRNKLTDLRDLGSLTSITKLFLSLNQLVDLTGLGSLTSLITLDLSYNKLTDLTGLTSLANLIRLNLRNNQIKNIPSEFFEKEWDVYWRGGHVPEGMNLCENPLEKPPVEIVKKGREAVLKYFASLEGEKRKLNEVKVLLVGDGGAGKTSLLKRIFGEPFDRKESQTKGIVIRDKRYRIDDQNIKAHFWDFGGQEIMHATHQFFLSKRSLYILVLDGRKEEEAEYWLQLIESFGGDSPILVVLNKMDENPSFDVNRRFLQEKYEGILGFYKVSCKDETGNGITGKEGIIQGIRGAFSRVKMLEATWPESWAKIKQKLERLDTAKEQFINAEQYKGICEKEGVVDTKEQDLLVDYLNDLGVILHFKGLDLADTHVLEPHWVTEAVYRIINAKKLADNKGKLQADDLKEILRKERKYRFIYPEGTYRFILELMSKFELCFWMEQSEGRMLIPDLQDVQKPALPELGADSIRFYYTYDYLPKSIMPRFTVRMHEDIQGDFRWRTGVVLRDEPFSATAVIESDKNAKRIYIEVFGQQKREYLSCIRKVLNDIHASFEKLDPVGWIPLPNSDEAVEYEELLGYWQMGKDDYFSGKLKRTFSVRELLDGIEKPEERKMKDEKDERHIHIEHGDYVERDKKVVETNYHEVVFGDKNIKIEYKNEYGLSGEDFRELIEGINGLRENERGQLKEPMRELVQAKTDDEKEIHSKTIKDYLVSYGIGVAGSMTAQGVLVLASKLMELF